jgi:hypothetical protein
MAFDKRLIGKQAQELGFIRDTFEKTLRLAEIMKFIGNDSLLSDYLALKGGTAINLTIFNLPRLSVDIDLDFTENLIREDMEHMRRRISGGIEKYMTANGYTRSGAKSKLYHTLDSGVYVYENAGGRPDNIKVEINYSLRAHVLSPVRHPIETPGISGLRPCFHFRRLRYSPRKSSPCLHGRRRGIYTTLTTRYISGCLTKRKRIYYENAPYSTRRWRAAILPRSLISHVWTQ